MSDALLLVGTTKGLFLFRAGEGRDHWERVGGPHIPGKEIYSTALDQRGATPRILAGATSAHWGPAVSWSDDLGASWHEPDDQNIAFPEGLDAAVARVWQLQPGSASQPGLVWAGVEPAALFRSDDGGETYELVQGLWDHPHRPNWQPGGGGLCLHTVVPHPSDPERMHIAISAAGVYRTQDGGATWEARNQGIAAGFLPDPSVEFGQCVHKVVRDPVVPETLYLQHHGGLYRSDDDGDSWREIPAGNGMDFGFPIVAHPRQQGTAYILPLDSDMFRATYEGRCRVFRTRDGGESWEALEKGLPQQDAFLCVLRDAFTTDGADPAGLYFGTRTGEVYGSADEGESWGLIAEHLPPVLCVRAALVD